MAEKYFEETGRNYMGICKSHRPFARVRSIGLQGKMMHIMLKVQDEDGEIRTVHQIQVHSKEEKRCVGVPSVKFLSSNVR